jgi:hypothetical protein
MPTILSAITAAAIIGDIKERLEHSAVTGRVAIDGGEVS